MSLTTYTVRSAVALGVPVYMAFNSSPRIGASVVVLSAPSTLYCALGAIEGVVRSCGYLGNWNKFSREMTTVHGLVRGALSPVSGYSIMVHEWNKLGLKADPGLPRVLKEEYYVYSVPRQVTKWTVRNLKFVVTWTAKKTIVFLQWGWRVTQPVRLWLWNTTVSLVTWSLNRVVDLWNISLNLTRPLRKLAKWIIWDFGVKIVLVRGVWPPMRFVLSLISSVIKHAFMAIAWATRQAFKLIK